MKQLSIKERLLAWVDEQDEAVGFDLAAKYVLEKLASFADAECCGWAEVGYLARSAMCSERKIQYRLRDLEARGLIKTTDRRHRLADSTRSVPIYQLAPEVEGLGRRASMGAKPAPIPAHGCKTDEVWVQGACTPNEPIEPTSEANASSERARERENALEEAFRETEANYPRDGLGYTDRNAAWAAFLGLAGQGVDVLRLPECAARMAADPKTKARSFPVVGMERWLGEGRYRGWWPDKVAVAARSVSAFAAPAGPKASGADQDIWVAIAGTLKAELGDRLFGSWFGPAYLGDDGDGPILVAATGTARDWISANAWKRAQALWADAAPEGRPLRLKAKRDFEVAR